MSRFIYLIVALAFIISLAACTVGGTADQTTSTTASSTTTSTTTAITTTTEDGSGSSDTTTSTTQQNETTTTTQEEQRPTSSGVKMYPNHPNAPDYGAMLGVTYSYTKTQNDSTGKQRACFYFYGVDVVSQVDPDAQSRGQYVNLLSENGYKPAGTVTDKENGLTYYGYECNLIKQHGEEV